MKYVRRKQLETKVCVHCGKAFQAVMPHARYCSAACCGKVIYRTLEYLHKCVECGVQFKTKQRKASVCSRPECRLALSVKGGRKGAALSPTSVRIHPSREYAYKLYRENRAELLARQPAQAYSREQIFERDGWVCQICGEPIDRSLKFPDKRSACIDHIRPIIAGGNDRRSNVQCAHFDCNSKKGASIPSEVI